MALAYTSDQITNYDLRPPAVPHSADEVYCVRSKVTLDASAAASDLIGFAKLPQGCIPVDVVHSFDDLDTGAGLTMDTGILNTDSDDLVTSSLLIDGTDAGQAGGIARMDQNQCAWECATWLAQTDAPGDGDPVVVAGKIATVASGAQAGDIYTTVFYRSKLDGK